MCVLLYRTRFYRPVLTTAWLSCIPLTLYNLLIHTGWLFNRETMEPSYAHFFDHHGQRTRPRLDAFIQLNGGPSDAYGEKLPMPIDVAIQKIRDECKKKFGISFPARFFDLNTAVNPHIQCHVLHPEHGDACHMSAAYFLVEGLKRAIPVYLPVYLIPLILFKSQVIVRHPIRTAFHTFVSVMRSSTFLATYCTIAMHAICAINRITGRSHHLAVPVAGFLGGFGGLLIERDSRQIELALYVLSHAVISWYRTWASKGILPPMFKHGNSAVFIVSSTILMWAYVNHPSTIRYSYFSLFRFLFGAGGRQERFIHAKGMSTKHFSAAIRKPRIAAEPDQDIVKT
jgi:hypothetical protein